MTVNSIEHQNSPSPSHRHFIYDPLGNGFLYFRSAIERDQAMDWVVQSYLDDEWSEEVDQIVAGEVTHACRPVDREDRPAKDMLDKNGCDTEGNHWGDVAFRCNYELLPLIPESFSMNPCKQGHRDVGASDGAAYCHQCDEKITAPTTQAAFEQWNATHPAVPV